jgi:hypothetical protein
LGFGSDIAVSRHERSKSIPDLLTAMGYEAIFRVPIATQFPELFESVAMAVETRIEELETAMQQQSATSRRAAQTARKLEFFSERKTRYSD